MVKVDGDITGRNATVRYFEDGRQRAAASLNRDHENLEDELALEKAVASAR
jgi:hypothetical protein